MLFFDFVCQNFDHVQHVGCQKIQGIYLFLRTKKPRVLPKYQCVKILGCQNFNIPKNLENTLLLNKVSIPSPMDLAWDACSMTHLETQKKKNDYLL